MKHIGLKEFKKLLSYISFGKDLNDALEDLKYRIPSDTINNIILNIDKLTDERILL